MSIILLILAIIIIILLLVMFRKIIILENTLDMCSGFITDNYVGIRALLKLKYNINLEELSDKYWGISNRVNLNNKEENDNAE